MMEISTLDNKYSYDNYYLSNIYQILRNVCLKKAVRIRAN